MKIRNLAVAASALALTACAGPLSDLRIPQPDWPELKLPEVRHRLCDSQPGELFIGQTADGATGEAIRQATRADEVRWHPPRTALTMEVVKGRVTVSYDESMRITSIACV